MSLIISMACLALAIWDVHKQRLVVARDAMGIKLVYYRSPMGS